MIDKSKWTLYDTPLTYARTKKAPLEDNTLWDSLSAAEAYVNNVDQYAYAGMTLAVVNPNNSKENGLYYVEAIGTADGSGTLKKIGSNETLSATNYDAAVKLAETASVGSLIKVAESQGTAGESDFRASGFYIVSVAGSTPLILNLSTTAGTEMSLDQVIAALQDVQTSLNVYKETNDDAVAAAKKAGDDAAAALADFETEVGNTVSRLEGDIATAKKAGDDAAAALEAYKETNDDAVAAAKKAGDDAAAALVNYVQKDGDKVLSDVNFSEADKSKLDGIDLSVFYTKEETYDQAKIDELISEVRTEATKDSFLSDVEIVDDVIKFTWVMADGTSKEDSVDVSKYIDTYANGEGLTLNGKTFAVDFSKVASVESLNGLSDSVTSSLTNYVQKDGDKVLSDVNFSEADKSKLDGIDLSKFYEKGDVYTKTETYTKGEVDTEISDAITGLESSINTSLTNYVQKDGDKVLSDVNFSEADKSKLDGIDLSVFYTKEETYTKGEVDTEISDAIDELTTTVNGELAKKADKTDLDSYYTKGEVDGFITDLETDLAHSALSTAEIDEAISSESVEE